MVLGQPELGTAEPNGQPHRLNLLLGAAHHRCAHPSATVAVKQPAHVRLFVNCRPHALPHFSALLPAPLLQVVQARNSIGMPPCRHSSGACLIID